MFHIMVVEDDRHTRRLMQAVLEQNGYSTIPAGDGEEALEMMDKHHVDLILLDVMMPRMDGFTFLKTLREGGCELPVLMVTAKEAPADKKRGFLTGVDDYMVKPVDMDELVLRVGALLRRARLDQDDRLTVGNLTLVRDEMAAYVDGEEVPVLPREFNVLYKLLSHPRKIFTRSELLGEHWGMTNESGLRTVDVYVAKLRKTFAGCDAFEIVTVHGFGYKAVIK